MFPEFHHQNPNSNPTFNHPSPTHTHSPPLPSNALSIPLPPPPTTDGASIEVVRRPRGRPPGSKNKPKPPVVIAREPSDPIMSPYVLELPAGVDIVESAARFCRRRAIGLCVLSGNGVVVNVTLKQPSAPGSTVTFHGRFDILSLTGTILPAASGPDPAGNGVFTLSLSGHQGHVVGGLVVGPLVAGGTVYLIAATFNNPSYHRLQSSDHDQNPDPSAAGDERSDSPKRVSAVDTAAPAPMYSFQASDVIWAPTARPPPQPQSQSQPPAPPY